MALPAGTRIGGYEITTLLGVGGMEEVYRARDTTLDRDVALKILPPEFARDADRLACFRHEARTLAAIGFFAPTKLMRLDLDASAPVSLAEVGWPLSAEWLRAGEAGRGSVHLL